MKPTLLFIPVSSPEGIGEYMRSLIIANAVIKEHPSADIRFILSEQASYAKSCPFTTYLTPTSPTKHTKQVNDIIEKVTPDITIFDASGRKSQLAAAKACGSKVIFISQHKKKRSRGLKTGRLRLTDIHWVVQPNFVIGDITPFERFKIKLFNKREPVNIGPVFSPVNQEIKEQLLNQHGLISNDYIIFNAGSGGHKIGEVLAADIYASTAEIITQELGIPCVMVYGDNYSTDMKSNTSYTAIKSLSNEQFIALVDAAKFVVISGGDALLQTIAMKKPCLTTPVSKDQPPRIAACADNKLVIATATDSKAMIESIKEALGSQSLLTLQEALNNSHCNNGLAIALQDIKRLLEENNNA